MKNFCSLWWCTLPLSYLASGLVTSRLVMRQPFAHEEEKSSETPDVSLMIPAIESDRDLIRVRLSHLMKNQNFPFRERCLCIDSHGENVSGDFANFLDEITQEGLIDTWKIVDYSPEYVKRQMKLFRWDHEANIKYLSFEGRYVGNLVYAFMIDACQSTYCAHFDLDITVWSKPEYSWIDDAVQLLEKNPQALTVVMPSKTMGEAPGCKAPALHWVKGERSWFLSINGTSRTLITASKLRAEPSCTLITARNYVLKAERYKKLLLAGADPKPSAHCGGDIHWESYMTCLASMNGMGTIRMTDSSSAWKLHQPFHNSSAMLEAILSNCIDRGIALTRTDTNGIKRPYDADTNASKWLELPCMANFSQG